MVTLLELLHRIPQDLVLILPGRDGLPNLIPMWFPSVSLAFFNFVSRLFLFCFNIIKIVQVKSLKEWKPLGISPPNLPTTSIFT